MALRPQKYIYRKAVVNMSSRVRSIRKVNMAASILSSFNFDATSYCVVSFYFSMSNGKAYGSSVDVPRYGESFKRWGKKEWRTAILEAAD